MARKPQPIPHGTFGPRERFGKPRSGGPDWLKVTGIIFGIVAVFVIGITAAYTMLVLKELDDVAQIRIPTELNFTLAPGVTETPPQPFVPKGSYADRTTILVVGSDSREGLTKEQLKAIGTNDHQSDLTDTIILAQIDPNTNSIALLSFPRDLAVRRCDGTRGRINEAWYIGKRQNNSAGCLIDTVQRVSGIHVDHILRVNFAGFVNIVDALGGVDFAVDRDMKDRWSGLNIKKGCNHFDGIKAIQFVRTRKIDSDFGRQARQQRFAKEMLKKALSLGVLANPMKVADTINSLSDAITTDTNFGPSQMIDLAVSLHSMNTENLRTYSIPARAGMMGESSVLFLQEKKAEEIFEAFQSGILMEQVEVPTASSTAPADAGAGDASAGDAGTGDSGAGDTGGAGTAASPTPAPSGEDATANQTGSPDGQDGDMSSTGETPTNDTPANQADPSQSNDDDPKNITGKPTVELPDQTQFERYAGSFDPGISC